MNENSITTTTNILLNTTNELKEIIQKEACKYLQGEKENNKEIQKQLSEYQVYLFVLKSIIKKKEYQLIAFSFEKTNFNEQKVSQCFTREEDKEKIKEIFNRISEILKC